MGVMAERPVVNSRAPSRASRIAGRTVATAVRAPPTTRSNWARAEAGVVSRVLVMPMAAMSGRPPPEWSHTGAGL
ncbi:hypothetical protein [Streptomyces sp. R41]|uniref:Uncharacterized protein n=1 Tax=Streptomyces sp. R41 TaxID=3238632 RepID=A0AB39R8P9_9ACTN